MIVFATYIIMALIDLAFASVVVARRRVNGMRAAGVGIRIEVAG